MIDTTELHKQLSTSCAVAPVVLVWLNVLDASLGLAVLAAVVSLSLLVILVSVLGALIASIVAVAVAVLIKVTYSCRTCSAGYQDLHASQLPLPQPAVIKCSFCRAYLLCLVTPDGALKV